MNSNAKIKSTQSTLETKMKLRWLSKHKENFHWTLR